MRVGEGLLEVSAHTVWSVQGQPVLYFWEIHFSSRLHHRPRFWQVGCCLRLLVGDNNSLFLDLRGPATGAGDAVREADTKGQVGQAFTICFFYHPSHVVALSGTETFTSRLDKIRSVFPLPPDTMYIASQSGVGFVRWHAPVDLQELTVVVCRHQEYYLCDPLVYGSDVVFSS